MKNLAPLRKIVGEIMWPIPGTSLERQCEVLECGHVRTVKQDIYGDTYAYRRRCHACRTGHPRHLSEAAIDEFRESAHAR